MPWFVILGCIGVRTDEIGKDFHGFIRSILNVVASQGCIVWRSTVHEDANYVSDHSAIRYMELNVTTLDALVVAKRAATDEVALSSLIEKIADWELEPVSTFKRCNAEGDYDA
jgi:hypothetical protein